MSHIFLKGLLASAALFVGLQNPMAYAENLPPAVISTLERALDDEQHAESFYAAVIDKQGSVRPFSNIIQAERRHAAMVVALLEKYGVTVPVNPYETGAKPKPETPPSLAEACKAGVDAEIANRDLYNKDLLPAVSGLDDVTLVLTALRDASENNHLPAFQRCVNNQS